MYRTYRAAQVLMVEHILCHALCFVYDIIVRSYIIAQVKSVYEIRISILNKS